MLVQKRVYSYQIRLLKWIGYEDASRSDLFLKFTWINTKCMRWPYYIFICLILYLYIFLFFIFSLYIWLYIYIYLWSVQLEIRWFMSLQILIASHLNRVIVLSRGRDVYAIKLQRYYLRPSFLNQFWSVFMLGWLNWLLKEMNFPSSLQAKVCFSNQPRQELAWENNSIDGLSSRLIY